VVRWSAADVAWLDLNVVRDGPAALRWNFLGVAACGRLGDDVLLAEVVRKTYVVDLSAYPRWFVVLVGTLLAALAIWITMKLLKWTLWLLFFAVLIGGIMWAMVLLVQ